MSHSFRGRIGLNASYCQSGNAVPAMHAATSAERTRTMTRVLAMLATLSGVFACTWTPAVAAPAAVESLHEPGQVDLRPRFVAGQQTRYTLETGSRSTLTCDQVPEMNGKQSMSQALGLTLRVLEATSDGATLELVYDTVRIKYESDDGSAEFDSAAPTRPTGNRPPTGAAPQADPELSRALESMVRGMVGAKLKIQTDSAGNIVSVTGDGGISSAARSFMQSAGQGLPGMPSSIPTGADAARWLIGGTRGTGLARVGETWTNEDTLGGTPLGDFRMTTRHTLRSHSGGTAKVAFSGRAEAASAAAAPSLLGFQLKGCTHEGAYEWDTARGMLSSMETDMRVSLEGSMTGVALKHESVNTVKVRRADERRSEQPPRPRR